VAIRLMAALLVGSLLAFAPAVHTQAPAKGSGSFEITGPVRVIDGDTIEIYVDGRQMAVGILGVKVPPANTSCGRRAAQFTQDLLNGDGRGAPITLRFEEDNTHAFDARKRRMYYLKLPGGVSAAAALVAAGFAEPDGNGNESTELALAAQRAPTCVG
jgi:endonuclease YncB( thermonuclease family)